jgi:hypothetical protein
MRSVWIVLGAVCFAACSSSSSSKVVRNTPDGGATRFMVARLTTNGALDTSWGNAGMTTPVPGRAFGMAQSGRYLLVVGTTQPGQVQPQSARIARYWLR